MWRAKIVAMLSAALIAMAASSPLLAKGRYHHHGGHGHSHGSVGFGFVFGGPWYYPGYYYPGYYYPPHYYPVRGEPTVYIERDDGSASSGSSQGYWYYCKESRAYHPYVKHCPGGWEKQVPTPAPDR
jgi:hypothetical protein